MIKFGVAGNSASFYEQGNKSTLQASKWCKNLGLDLFEYSFGQGILLSDASALELGEEFLKNDIELSVHTPYFINFSNTDEDMVVKSIGYVTRSIQKLILMKGTRAIVHPASQGKASREDAVAVAIGNIKRLNDILNESVSTEIKICFETMGKMGQIGTLDEIITFCDISERFYPCIDFGHINAREQGILNCAKNYNTLIVKMLDNMPFDKVNNMHCHFSKIMYGAKGEVKHLTFEDTKYGPEFEPLAEILQLHRLSPHIICESSGSQAEDAVYMKNFYNNL